MFIKKRRISKLEAIVVLLSILPPCFASEDDLIPEEQMLKTIAVTVQKLTNAVIYAPAAGDYDKWRSDRRDWPATVSSTVYKWEYMNNPVRKSSLGQAI